jgi:exopolyphosphatase/guanosine-5'-triphosphate,3'-diphosphate pyrophosphatase
MEQTLEALARFRAAGPGNGPEEAPHRRHRGGARREQWRGFPQAVAALGLKPRCCRAAEEAELSGLGVISGNPRANGIVADLGGGSLELSGSRAARRGRGVAAARRAARRPEPDQAAIAARSAHREGPSRLKDAARGHGLYLVGGSFRALAMLDLKTARPPAADRPPASHPP